MACSHAEGILDMTKPILVVTSRYTKEIEDRIDRDFNARRNPNQFPFSQQHLLSAAEGADALFITPTDRLDSGFFQKASPTIKIIATHSVGFEHIDLEAAARRKISVAYTPGVNHYSVVRNDLTGMELPFDHFR
jgi:lactate dehydrogenase-like 2-hydroxyacid dehydrogenase